jgi:hypothetical protein
MTRPLPVPHLIDPIWAVSTVLSWKISSRVVRIRIAKIVKRAYIIRYCGILCDHHTIYPIRNKNSPERVDSVAYIGG